MRTVNALGFGVGTLAEVGEVWNSPIPAIMDAVGTGSVGSLWRETVLDRRAQTRRKLIEIQDRHNATSPCSRERKFRRIFPRIQDVSEFE